MLTDTLNAELSDVGPEDVLTDARLDELQYALTKQVILATMLDIFKFSFL